MKLINTCIFSILIGLPAVAASTEAMTLSSGPEQTILLELYTSEGCSSCPPADRWLSKLKQDPKLWRDIVPVAFHVDYWNYLGWSDKFSRAEFSNRQRHYAALRYTNTVYTPGFFQNGREWRGWFSKPKITVMARQNVGVLSISINKENLTAKFTSINKLRDPLKLNIAVLGLGIKSVIEDGENEGKTFIHDFVVLSFQHIAGQYKNDRHLWDTVLHRLSNKRNQIEAKALAVWVTRGNDPTPIQALGGWL